jgi:hypothetical protein
MIWDHTIQSYQSQVANVRFLDAHRQDLWELKKILTAYLFFETFRTPDNHNHPFDLSQGKRIRAKQFDDIEV